ncbi:MAG: glycosyltransferase [Nitrospirales bacterium]|nr:glycosyltransferase [Nitrospira sp.]MDR4502077.1 glycosyltransferase [Nitrospirales bacterium]
MADLDQQKIRVVRIIARLNVGGPAKQALFLTQSLNNQVFQSYLIAGAVGANEENLAFPPSFPENRVYSIPMLGREISWWQDIRAFFEISKVLKTIRPHIVHTHTAKAGTLGRLAAMWTSVPIKIHTFHGHVFKGYFSRWKTSFFIFIEKILAYFTDRIVVLSESQRRDLAQTFKIAPSWKFQVIPLGFNLSPFISHGARSSSRIRFGIELKSFVIGFIGRLVPIKNPFLLLEAYDQAKAWRQRKRAASVENLQPWSVIVVGGGELHDAMQSEVLARGLSQQVVFYGWQHEVQHVHAAVNVVVLTSLNEGTPVALIEAMAASKPFIATNVGGVADLMIGEGKRKVDDTGGSYVIFRNGILVDSQDSHGLASALLYVFSHPDEAQEMGRVGRDYAVKHFDESRLLGDVRALYQDLLAQKKRQGGSAEYGNLNRPGRLSQ